MMRAFKKAWDRLGKLAAAASGGVRGRRPRAGTGARDCRLESLEQRALLSINTGSLSAWQDGVPPVESAWFDQVASSSSIADGGAVRGDSGEAPDSSLDSWTLSWQGEDLEAMVGQWIVQLTPEAAARAGSVVGTEAMLRNDSFTTRVLGGVGMEGLVVVQTDRGVSPDATAAWLSANPDVDFFEPNGVIRSAVTTPNDDAYQSWELWGLNNMGQWGGSVDADIDAPEAWDLTTGSDQVVVGVIDSGVDYTHPDLAANIWVNPGEIAGNGIDDDDNGFIDDVHGYDFAENDGDPMDVHGHGTHCSGTIAGVGNNSIGVVGVSWNSKIMAIRSLGDEGSGTTAAGIQSVNYASMMRQKGVNIRLTSNSWGGGGYSSALRNAIIAQGELDMLFIAAAGNDFTDNDLLPHYPSNYIADAVISVASTNRHDELSVFSNFGEVTVDIAAPGSDIYSTVPYSNDGWDWNDYAYKSGTSMATPHVAGVAALAWSLRPGASAAKVKDAILSGGDLLTSLDDVVATGRRLNALGTLNELLFSVVGSNPADGQVVSTPPTEVTVVFSEAYDPATVAPSDFTLSNVPADSVVFADANTLTFSFTTSPVTAQGPQLMRIAGGAIGPVGASIVPMPAWNAVIFYDLVPTVVVSTTPFEDEVLVNPPTQIILDFNEPILGGSIGPGDFAVSSGQVTGGWLVDADSVAFAVQDVALEGPITYWLTAGGVRDQFGNPAGAYEGHFLIDNPALQRYEAEAVPRWIVDGMAIRSTITVPDNFELVDIDVLLDIEHGHGPDLATSVESPLDERTTLFNQLSLSSGTFTETYLDDDANRPIVSGITPYSGRFQPVGSLDALAGTGNPSVGDWTLEIDDLAPSSAGLLYRWAIILHRDVARDTPPTVAIDGLPLAGSSNRVSPTAFHATFSERMDIDTVNDPAAWSLVEAGADGLFDTADDVVSPITMLEPLVAGGRELDFTLDAAPLTAGSYRLSAASGGMVDFFGIALDGDGDGISGDDLSYQFNILATARAFPVFESFESAGLNGLEPYWELGQSGSGLAEVTSANGPLGSYHLNLSNDNDAQGEATAVLHADLIDIDRPASNVRLDFWHKSTGSSDFQQGLIQLRQGDADVWHDVFFIPHTTAWTSYSLDIDALAAGAGASGLLYTHDFQIRFTHRGGSGSAVSQASSFDQIQLDYDNVGASVVGDIEQGPAGWPRTVDSLMLFFNEEIDPASFTLEDIVSFVGPEGDMIDRLLDVTGSGQLFTVSFYGRTTPGDYTMVVGPDILDLAGNPMNQDGDRDSGEVPEDRYTATFHIAALPRIESAFPIASAVGGIESIRVNYNRLMYQTSFSPGDDILRFDGPDGPIAIGAYQWLDGDSLDLRFARQWTPGDYELILRPTMTDIAGTPIDQNQNLIPAEEPADQYVVSFTLQTPTGPDPHVLYPGESVAVDDGPRDVLTVDLNRDGVVDVVTVNQFAETVSVLLGGLPGTFAPVVDYPAGNSPMSFAAGDLDGDGRPDIVVVGRLDDAVRVLLNGGNGSLIAPVSYDVGDEPASVVVADLTGDGLADVAVANRGDETVSLLVGLGDGTLAEAVSLDAKGDPAGLAVGDFDEDGVFDLVVIHQAIDEVSILLSNGDGTFTPGSALATGHDPRQVTSGDLSGDGHDDLVVVNRGGATVTVLLGNGDGAFGVPVDYRVGSGSQAVSLGDVDGDGVLDVVTGNAGDGSASVLLGNGDGTLRPATAFDTGGWVSGVATADIDLDGFLDIVTASSSGDDVSFLLGSGDGTFPSAATVDLSDRPTDLVLIDLTGDGLVEAVTTHENDGTVSVMTGLADGTFGAERTYSVGSGPVAVEVADVNADGLPDLVVALSGDNALAVLAANSDGSFADPVLHAVGTNPTSVGVADFNGDGLADLVSADRDSSRLSVLLGAAGGGYGYPTSVPASFEPVGLVVEDIDQDGHDDVVFANYTLRRLVVLYGDGTGELGHARYVDVETWPTSVTVDDVNSDGELDLVASNRGSRSVSVVLGAGARTFDAGQHYPVAGGATSVAVGDVNHDGLVDLAVTGDRHITVLAGTAEGTFPRQAAYAAGTDPLAVAVADLNGDGFNDLVAVNQGDDTLSVLMNQRKRLHHAPAGDVGGWIPAMQFHFPWAMDTTSFALADDVISFEGPAGPITPTSFTWIDNLTLEVAFPAQSAEGEYRMLLGADILDVRDVGLDVDRDWVPGEPVEDRYEAIFTIVSNQTPVAADDQFTTTEDDPLLVLPINGMLANDLDPDPTDRLSVVDVDTTGLQGTLIWFGHGGFAYDPGTSFQSLATGQSAVESFSYTVTDPLGATATATVDITVQGSSDPPTAVDDTHATDEDTALAIDAAGGMLLGDFDLDAGAVLHIESVDTTGLLGTLGWAPDGSFTYDPTTALNFLAANQAITETFTYTVADQEDLTAVGTVTIVVAGRNDAPVTPDPVYSTDEDNPLDVPMSTGLLMRATDPDTTDSLTLGTIDDSGLLGQLTVDPDGGFSYDPTGAFQYLAQGESANETFTFTVTDSQGTTATGTVTITVDGLNDAPVASLVTYDVEEDATLDVDQASGLVAAGATDPDDSDVLLLDSVDDSSLLGQLVAIADGSFTYEPAARFNALAEGETATEVFSYTVIDPLGLTDLAVARLTVLGQNDAPVAGDLAYSTDEEMMLLIPIAQGLFSGASDPDDSDVLSIQSVDATGMVGSLIWQLDGSFTYDPRGVMDHLAVGATAVESFTYVVEDPLGLTATATVDVTVTGRNDSPVASSQAYTTDEDSSLTINAPGLLAGATDPDAGDSFTLASVNTSSLLGQLDFNPDGSFTYDPAGAFDTLASGETATDVFGYTLTDTQGASAAGVATITIEGLNDPPTAGNPTYDVDADSLLTITDVAAGLLSEADDPDPSDTLSVQAVDTSSLDGLLTSWDAQGRFTYDPDGLFEALGVGETVDVAFSYTIADAQGVPASGTATITIHGVNATPVYVPGLSYDVDEDTPRVVAAVDGLINAATDPDANDVLSIQSVDTSGLVGSLVWYPSGSFTYYPNGNFENLAVGQTATETFTCVVTDPYDATVNAQVTFVIHGANDAPVADDHLGSYQTDEETLLTVLAAGGLLNNSTDPDDGDATTLTVLTVDDSQLRGTLAAQPDGSFTYDPSGAFDGLDAGAVDSSEQFTYTITDPHGGTDDGIVVIRVTGLNDPPTLDPNTFFAMEDELLSVDEFEGLLLLADDPDATDSVSVQAVDTTGLLGELTWNVDDNADGSFSYDPNGQFENLAVGQSADENFLVTVVDEAGATAQATFTIRVDGQNDVPMAIDHGAFEVAEDATLDIPASTLLEGASDPDDGDTLTMASVDTSALRGQLTSLPNGSFTYDPNGAFDILGPGQTDTDSLTYTITDPHGGTSTEANVTITVRGSGTPPVASADEYTLDEDASWTIDSTSGLLANDSASPGGGVPRVLSVDDSGLLGTLVSWNEDGSFTYDPGDTFNHLAVGDQVLETFQYTIIDANNGEASDSVLLRIDGRNDDPTLDLEPSYSVAEEGTLIVLPDEGLLIDADDPDSGDELHLSMVNDGSLLGTLGWDADGGLTYDPSGQFDHLGVNQTAWEVFTFTVADDHGGTVEGTATILVTGLNDSPVITPPAEPYVGFSTVPLIVPVDNGLLAGAVDPDGDTLIARVAIRPLHGHLDLRPNGSFVYTPLNATALTDTFTYYVEDGTTSSATMTVTIELEPFDLDGEELGRIDQVRRDGHDLSADDAIYHFEADHTGWLTLQALFDQSIPGEAHLFAYDDEGLALGTSTNAGNEGERLDLWAIASTSYYVRMRGTHPSADLRLTNLVFTEDNRVKIHGTDGDDRLLVADIYPSARVSINDVTYEIDGQAPFPQVPVIEVFHFDGHAGSDTLQYTASSTAMTVRLGPDGGSIVDNDATMTFESTEHLVAYGSGAGDVVEIVDSPGDDQLVVHPSGTTFSGHDFSHTLTGFPSIHAVASAGGHDVAVLYDTIADDVFVGTSLFGEIATADRSYVARADGFEHLHAQAVSGGRDVAQLYDSSGADRLVVKPTVARMIMPGATQWARNFEVVDASANTGGRDKAILKARGEPAKVKATPRWARIRGTEYLATARTFEHVVVRGLRAGGDRAVLIDSAAADSLVATAGKVIMQSDTSSIDYRIDLINFNWVKAKSTSGRDRARVDQAIDYLILRGAWET